MSSSTKLLVKVVPGASRTGVVGWLGDRLKVRVSAPPERGKANAAVEHVIAAELGMPPGSVSVISGGKSPLKVVQITGLASATVSQKLKQPAGVN